jgi:hypothetical protein
MQCLAWAKPHTYDKITKMVHDWGTQKKEKKTLGLLLSYFLQIHLFETNLSEENWLV